MKTKLTLISVLLSLNFSSIALAQYIPRFVAINGIVLTPQERISLAINMNRRGLTLVDGHYLIDVDSGCWEHLETGVSNCYDNNTQSQSEKLDRESDNGWTHYDSDYGTVGGFGNGCYYAFGWSNC